MSLWHALRHWMRGHESQERDEAVRQAIRHSDEVADRVQRIVQSDRDWERLRRKVNGSG